jgi:hypothetical protein
MFSNFLLGFSSKHREDRPLWDAVYDQFLLQPKMCLSCPAQMSFSLSLSLSLSLSVLEDAVMYIDVYCNLKL